MFRQSKIFQQIKIFFPLVKYFLQYYPGPATVFSNTEPERALNTDPIRIRNTGRHGSVEEESPNLGQMPTVSVMHRPRSMDPIGARKIKQNYNNNK